MHSKRPRGLIVSPYHAASHAIWVEQLIANVPLVQWRVLTMPARFFNWRIRGNPLSLVYEDENVGAFNDLDLLVVTSMTDLASLRGLLPQLNGVPSMIYFHENQFAYPSSREQDVERKLEPKMVTLYGALAADVVVFNSNFNRDTFIAGASKMLAAFPDHAPLNCLELIANKSAVIPVPLPSELHQSKKAGRGDTASGFLKVAWNHRWEYDKGPERLARIIELADQIAPGLQFYIFGQSFRQTPNGFTQLAAASNPRIKHMGYIPDQKTYWQQLAQCDVVLSTALHDFQGLAVLEAVALGCIPVVPDRLAYQEFIPAKYRYASYPDDLEAECTAVVECLSSLQDLQIKGELPRVPLPDCVDTEHLKKQYRRVIDRLLAHSGFALDGDSMLS